MSTAVTDFDGVDTGKKKKKKAGKKKSSSKTDKSAAAGAPAAKKKKAEKPKTALSMPDEEEEEIDLVAKMEEARRAMPNACVVSPTGVNLWVVLIVWPCDDDIYLIR